jgi:diguanylate cyclase (GGDEF)-like protein
LLLPETPLDGAEVVAEKVRKGIESMSLTYEENKLPTITASFGVACFPDHGNNAETIIAAVDIALYQSKNHGRNCVSIAKC